MSRKQFHCAAALELINPATARAQRLCKLAVFNAFHSVVFEMEKDRLRADPFLHTFARGFTRERLERSAKKFRALETDKNIYLTPLLRESVKTELQTIKWLLAGSAAPSRPGGPRKSLARISAVWHAHALLAKYRSGRPGLTVGGVWHQLANILFEAADGGADTDLFGYLRDYHKARSARDCAAAANRRK